MSPEKMMLQWLALFGDKTLLRIRLCNSLTIGLFLFVFVINLLACSFPSTANTVRVGKQKTNDF